MTKHKPRLSGNCMNQKHEHCLGPLLILPCTCKCHEYTDPERR